MPIFSHSHSATYWQQEMTCFIHWCTPPRGLTTSTSNVVRKPLRPWWRFIVKIVSFRPMALPWWRCKFGCFGMTYKDLFERLGMLENSPNLAHTSEMANIVIWYGSWLRVQQGSPLQRTTTGTFHLYAWNLEGTCIMSRLFKKAQGVMLYTQQEVSHFEFSGHFCRFTDSIPKQTPPTELITSTSNLASTI